MAIVAQIVSVPTNGSTVQIGSAHQKLYLYATDGNVRIGGVGVTVGNGFLVPSVATSNSRLVITLGKDDVLYAVGQSGGQYAYLSVLIQDI